jgi:hypothetical protein
MISNVRSTGMDSKKNELVDSLDKLEDVYKDFFHWLAGQYDPTSGGFYYARSSFADRQFPPDIESTAQALNIIIRNNLLN